MWNVEFTDEFGAWWQDLGDKEQEMLAAAVGILERDGPALGRPLVDTLKGSRLANLKELRVPTSALRVLFAFDPRRSAILLLGGNKERRWQLWYRWAIPEAERLYAVYLDELRAEGELL